MKTCICILFFIFLSSTSYGLDIFVDNQLPLKCDNNYSIQNRNCSGNEGIAFNRIQPAINIAKAGDIIYIRSGLYAESVKIVVDGKNGNPITLTSFNNEIVNINGGNNPAIIDNIGCEYIVLENLNFNSNANHTIHFNNWDCADGSCGGSNHWIIRNNTIIGSVKIRGSFNLFEGNEVDGSHHKGFEDGVWELYNAHHNTYRNNHIHNFNSRGIWSMHRTHNSIFENNHVHHIQKQRYSMGIDIDGYETVMWSHTIRGNHIHNCDQAGIELENTFNSVVENNIVYNTRFEGIHIINYDKCQEGGGYGASNCIGLKTGNIVRQNVIYNAGNEGGVVSHSAGGVNVLGNTLYKNIGPGVGLYGDSPGWEISSNIIFENSGIEIYTGPNVLISSFHNMFHDPHFVDPLSKDFHLRSTSPAIDTGIDIGLPTDIEGNIRPQGAGWDIGAYEYSSDVVTILPSSPSGLKIE